MNTKKHKSKNRGKVIPTPIPKPEANCKVEEVASEKCSEGSLNSQNITQDQSEVIETEEIKIKNLDQTEATVEMMSTAGETPVKPKRNKGKKKKQTAVEEHQEDIRNEDFEKVEAPEESLGMSDVKPNDSTTVDSAAAKPSVRKKKKKDKKHIELSREIQVDTKFDENLSNPEQDVTLENQENEDKDSPQVAVKASKKNKKKKRRHDSDKSDKPDEKISCTAAFEELIDTKTDNTGIEALEKNKESQELLKEQTVDAVSTDLILSTGNQNTKVVDKTDDANLTQKKKKEEKKQLPKLKNDIPKYTDGESTIQINDETKINFSNSVVIQTVGEDKLPEIRNDSIENIVLQSTVTEEIKPKATIAKPIQKKLVQGSDLKSPVKIKKNENLESNIPVSIITETDKKEKEDNSSLTGIDNDPNTLTPSESNVIGQYENEKDCLEQNTSNFECIDNAEVKQPMTEKKIIAKCQEASSETDNDEIKVGSNIGVNLQTHGTSGSSDYTSSSQQEICDEMSKKKEVKISENEDTTDTTDATDAIASDESCFNVRDSVRIARSISQQMLDNNTNRVIQDITSKHEQAKLEMPTKSRKKVKGSGETPVCTPTTKSTNISVTKADNNKNQEQNDLKSKMMEVNQDLEQIRLSLEKSLMELTTLKDTHEIFQNDECEDLDASKISKNDTLVKQSDVYEPSKDIKSTSDTSVKESYDRVPSKDDKNGETDDDSSAGESKAQKACLPCFENSDITAPPISPPRKNRNCKAKSKKKRRQEPVITVSQSMSVTSETRVQDNRNEDKSKSKEKGNSSDERSKQQSSSQNEPNKTMSSELQFEPIENFEDALTSSVDDVEVNKTFEIIASELNNDPQNYQPQKESFITKPEINITPPFDDEEKKGLSKNVNPVSQPKNLLGYPNIPVPSNKTDYKKEKNKTPNEKQAKVKIKYLVDAELDTESSKKSKESQTDTKIKFVKDRNEIESFSYVTDGNEEYVYKYIFRKVFLSSVCHICRKELKQTRVPCKFCNLLFYCSQKHKDEDWPRHQSLCFAVSTVVHLKDLKHIYGDTKNVTGQNYRLIRMQMILSCEKVLKRKLLPWEQEALLYPRICADVKCREWRQSKLIDCDGCGQVSYCIDNPDHLPSTHQRWCKSYALYQKLVLHQQLHGRLEPKLPGKVMVDDYVIPDKINEVLASMYEEKIDMSDIQYATLTQVASAPLTVAFCYQLYRHAINATNGYSKKSCFTIHAVGAELQLEADSLAKWELFLLHLRPGVRELRVALVGQHLRPANLPLNLLGKIRLCESCRASKRRVQFSFQDKRSYQEYWSSDDFTIPDIVCAFNPNIQRSSLYNEVESWSATINCIFKQKIPFLITSCTMNELNKDLEIIKKYAEVNYKVIAEAKQNPFASVRPDRNFITDDEAPLLFKNYCFSLLCGA